MQIVVDQDFCALHGQCVFAAPDLFAFDDEGGLTYVRGSLDDTQRPLAEAAAAVCPTAAIELVP